MIRFPFASLASSAAVLAIIAACSSSESGSSSGKPPGGSSSGDPGNTPDGSRPDSSSGSSGQPAKPTTLTLTQESMEVGGQTRTYILGLPAHYDAAKTYPLVMVFHGNPSDGAFMAKWLPFDVASKEDAIIVYPDAIDQNWDLSTATASNRDFAFIKALPDQILKKHKIDKKKVFGSGYSGGGFFLNQMTCRVPNVFRAFASHAGGAPFKMDGESYNPDDCIPCTFKVPSIHTHGRQDDAVGYDSGYYAAACSAIVNQCSDSDPNNWSSTAPEPCKKAPGCTTNPVTLCWVEGLGHDQWSEASSASWQFFQSLP